MPSSSLNGRGARTCWRHATGMTLRPLTQPELTEPGNEPPAQQEPCPPVLDPGPLVRVSGPRAAQMGRVGAQRAGEAL